MEFLSEWQAEYIKLIYGTAFVILASVCFSTSKNAGRRLPWVWLGLFGAVQGALFWTLCLTTDYSNIYFPIVKTCLQAASFLCLAEFGRASIVIIKGQGPGKPLLIPFIMLAVLAAALKPGAMQGALLYVLGLSCGMLAAGALFLASRKAEMNAARLLKTGSAAIGIYALLAAFPCPTASHMAGMINSEIQLDTFSLYIKISKVLLILCLSTAVWLYSQAAFRQDTGEKYYAARIKFAVLAAVLLVAVLWLGSVFTSYLEQNARNNLQYTSENNAASLSDYLNDDLREVDHAATAIAGDNLAAAALLSGAGEDVARANQVLDRYHAALEEPVCYLIDIRGNVIASSNRNDPDSYVGHNYSFRPYFRQAMSGENGRYFALGVTSGKRGYYSGYPVWDGQGNIIGIAVVKRKIDNLESAFKQYPLCFFADPHGIVFLSSRPDKLYTSLWPLSEGIQQALADSRQFGSSPFQNFGLQYSDSGKDIVFEGRRYIQASKLLDGYGWSVVLLTPTGLMRPSWLPGLFITLFLSFLTNIFFVSKQRSTEGTALLSASEENYRSIFNGVNEAIFVHEIPGGRVVDVNQKTCEMYGCSREDILNTEFKMFSSGRPPYTPEEASWLINKAAQGEPQLFDWLAKDSSGKLLWIEVNLKRVTMGGRERVLAVVRDINERKQAEEALRVSEQRFSKIFNSSPSLISITTYGEGRFVEINERFTQIMGYSTEEIIGRTAADISIWVKPKRAEIIKMLRENGLIHNLECILRKKSGEVYTGLYSAEIVNFSGELFILSAVNDITERKRLEEEMARLERLNLIGEMAAGIGHEIRNPMTTVRGLLQLLGSKADSSHNKEYYNLMIDELDRANSIISEFLSLAKNRTVSKKMLSLNSIVEVLFPLIQADAMRTDKFIQFAVGRIPDLLLDEKEIRQLVLNLVRNGLEAMPPGGRVTIKTFKEGENVVLAVQDEGKGIEQEALGKLGTPFYTTKDSGTGLGLAVCFSIAARHNASIKVETSPAGTTFFVVFAPQ